MQLHRTRHQGESMNHFDILKMARDASREKIKVNRKWNALADKAGKVSCRKCGHDYCCYQFVSCGLFEGVLIANALIHNGNREMLKRVVDQGKRQDAMLEAAGWRPNKIDRSAWQTMCEDWFRAQEPCALLVDGRCSLYGIRPTSCSTYVVYNPPEDCQGPEGKVTKGGDNGIPITVCMDLDSAFYRRVLELEDAPLVPPRPMGLAVFAGLTLLTEGPAGLAQHTREIKHAEMESGGRTTTR